jgi:hypothetical protein
MASSTAAVASTAAPTTAAAVAATASTTAVAATAAAVTATTAATTAAAAAGRTCFARPGLIDGQRPTFDGLTIELRDSGLGICLRTHRHEGKSARLAGEFILHKRDLRDRAGLGKKLLQFVFRRIEGKIAYV